MRRKSLILAPVAWIFATAVLAQAGPGGNTGNAVGLWGQDSITGAPCIVGVAPSGSSTCGLPTIAPPASAVATMYPSTDSSTTITTGGMAQALFGGATPAHGFKIAIPVASGQQATFVCFVSDSTATPSATTPGSWPVYAGGGYSSNSTEKPSGAVYIVCPTTGQVVSAKSW